MLTLLPSTVRAAPAVPVTDLPMCGTFRPAGGSAGVLVPWEAVLDADGVVTAYHLVVRGDGRETDVRTGPRGFGVAVATDRFLVGERSGSTTQLAMLDTRRACRLWARSLDLLAYDVDLEPDGGSLRLAIHDPDTRRFEGNVRMDAETGATNAMIDGQCSSSCDPNDGDLPPAAYAPAGVARPVPSFPAGGWPLDQRLPFDWQGGATPPAWARTPVQQAADDAKRTGASRNPALVYRDGARNTVRYTAAFPTFCRYGIACASRAMPSWAIWIRPHGTDFSWGTLRWCQKRDAAGCFDLRRVTLHELGHVAGLDHPSNAGFRLAASETIMHAITPAVPSAGSKRHAYGRCDVATLQELYDVPDRTTRISSCNDLDTVLVLEADDTSLKAGQKVVLRATLRVADRAAYGRLAGNGLNERSVKLRYRPAGSDGAWTTMWMKPLAAAGRYGATLTPLASWDLRAVYSATDDEGLHTSRSDILRVQVAR